MATKKAPAKGKKRSVTKKQHTPDYYPVQRMITLGRDGGTFSGALAGDTGKLLSIENRRLYRQGMLYQIKLDIDIDITVGVDTEVEVYALANNWDVQRAYALAKDVYDRAHADELSQTAVSKARWSDFRVENGLTTNEVDPVRYDNALAIVVKNDGEHEFSSVDKAGTDTTFTWGTAAASRLDILDEWIRSGQVSTDPSNISTTVPYDGVNTDELSNTEMENLQQDGNNPPYSTTSDSDPYVKVASLYFRPGATGMQRLSTGFFDAPCGIFVLKMNNALPNDSVKLTVKAGDYKGVHAQRMCQG